MTRLELGQCLSQRTLGLIDALRPAYTDQPVTGTMAFNGSLQCWCFDD